MSQTSTTEYIELIRTRIMGIQVEIIDQGAAKGNLDLEGKKRLTSILQETIDRLENELLLEELNWYDQKRIGTRDVG